MSLLSHSLNPLSANASENVQRAYQKRLVDNAKAGLIILTSMSPKFHNQYKTVDVNSIVRHLREHYHEQVRTERSKGFEMVFGSKIENGTSLVQHALNMYEHIENLN